MRKDWPVKGGRRTKLPAGEWFYKRGCQEKYFPVELKPAEDSPWHPAPPARIAGGL
jgi:hypothetical protein